MHPSGWSGLGVQQSAAFTDAVQAWKTLCPEAKRIAKKDAVAHNKRTRSIKVAHMTQAAQEPNDIPSLWDIGRGSKFPVHPDDVRKMQHAKGETARLAAAWAESTGSKCPESLSFPSAVAYRRRLPSSFVGLDPDGLAAVNEIMSGLKLLFGKRGTEMEKEAMKFSMNLVLVKHSSGPGMLHRCLTLLCIWSFAGSMRHVLHASLLL